MVVTHHAPSLHSTRDKGEYWDRLYGSDLDALIEECGPALWIHGHVHDSTELRQVRFEFAPESARLNMRLPGL